MVKAIVSTRGGSIARKHRAVRVHAERRLLPLDATLSVDVEVHVRTPLPSPSLSCSEHAGVSVSDCLETNGSGQNHREGERQALGLGYG
eukprot:6190457-Pleurochrysis_carterae.AAC.2